MDQGPPISAMTMPSQRNNARFWRMIRPDGDWFPPLPFKEHLEVAGSKPLGFEPALSTQNGKKTRPFGASDDKGQFFLPFCVASQAWLQPAGLPGNLKVAP